MCQKLVTLQLDLLQLKLPHWRRAGGHGAAIQRAFYFEDFSQACGFMALVSRKARELKHPVAWSAHGSAVELTLSSSEVQGLSDHDMALARFADTTFTQRALPAGLPR